MSDLKCKKCGKILIGQRRKFCSNKCYITDHRIRMKRRRELVNRGKLTPRICIQCGDEFMPVRDRHYCCSKPCRLELTLEQQKILRAKMTPVSTKRWGGTGASQRLPEYRKRELSTPTALSLDRSNHKEEIEKFLNNGGKVLRCVPEPDGKIPSINLSGMGGWTIDTIMGLGLEIAAQDELIDSGHGGLTDAGR